MVSIHVSMKYNKRRRASIAYMESTCSYCSWHFYDSSLRQTCFSVLVTYLLFFKTPQHVKIFNVICIWTLLPHSITVFYKKFTFFFHFNVKFFNVKFYFIFTVNDRNSKKKSCKRYWYTTKLEYCVVRWTCGI